MPAASYCWRCCWRHAASAIAAIWHGALIMRVFDGDTRARCHATREAESATRCAAAAELLHAADAMPIAAAPPTCRCRLAALHVFLRLMPPAAVLIMPIRFRFRRQPPYALRLPRYACRRAFTRRCGAVCRRLRHCFDS